MNKYIIFVLYILIVSCQTKRQNQIDIKPTILILGGTPSTSNIVTYLPDSLKSKYRFISFSRPGFGGTQTKELNRKMLISLAHESGLQQGDYGVIGISGGAMMAITLAKEFKLKNCGIIGGMVTKDAYFNHADSAITKAIFEMALRSYSEFYDAVSQFPNVDQIIEMAEAPSKDIAIKACYDEFNYLLSDNFFENNEINKVNITWYHGENDRNVPLDAVKEFLSKWPTSNLVTIADKDHSIDPNDYIGSLLSDWK